MLISRVSLESTCEIPLTYVGVGHTRSPEMTVGRLTMSGSLFCSFVVGKTRVTQF